MQQCKDMPEAEQQLLDRGISWYTSHRAGAGDNASCCYQRSDVPVEGGETLHEVRYFRGTDPADPVVEAGIPIVLLHGFGAGVGIYYSALPVLRELWTGPVIALDWHGCSLSSRPEWSLSHGEGADVRAIADFFVQPLEQWRAARGFERLILLGHSMGGYLAGVYAERHPDRVENLILCSPAGLSCDGDEGAEPEKLVQRLGWSRLGINPLMVVWKLSIAAGRGPLRKWFQGFADAPWLEKAALTEYHYQSTLHGPISGGHCLTGLLTSSMNGRQGLSRRLSTPGCPPLTFIYGDQDPFLEKGRPGMRVLSAGRGEECRVLRVAKAGHDMMVENPIGFAQALEHAASQRPTEGEMPAFDVPALPAPAAVEESS